MVSLKNRMVLWARAAGRCQYDGCNALLIGDLISGNAELNAAYIAHIVAESPDGPRGDPVRSPLLADDVGNLMLMCDPHHRLIDREAVSYHPESLLLAMKARHEARIEAVSAIAADRGSHVLLYGARIGEHDFPVRFDLAKAAMLPHHFPAEPHPIQIDIARLDFRDDEPDYWDMQVANLRRQFFRKVREPFRSGEIAHLSLFALAPQPLLVELGRLLSDIAMVTVHQLRREPQGWGWLEGGAPVEFVTRRSAGRGERVALKLALSATITDDRIVRALGRVPIWELTTTAPHNDLMRCSQDLSLFRLELRSLFDRIKAEHGESAVVHVFPALPVSAAVEVGRVWMPKADLPLVVYDQRRESGFVACLTVGDDPVELPKKEYADA